MKTRTLSAFAVVVAAAGAILAATPTLPMVAWKVKSDIFPGTLSTQPANAAPAAAVLALDPYRIKTTLAMNPLFKDSRELIVPSRPSKYVLTTGSFSGWELWDLKLGAKEKESKGKIEFRRPMLSPDGRYIAGYKSSGRENAIEVLSLTTGQRLLHVDVARDSWNIEPLGFIGKDSVIFFDRSHAVTNLLVYDLTTGKSQATIPIEQNVSYEDVALSPAGKYAAYVLNSALYVYDLSTGEISGCIDFSDKSDPSYYRSSGVAFSADGVEIAVAQTATDKLRMSVFSIATGRLLTTKTSPRKDIRNDKLERVQYSPDGMLLLVDCQTVVDRTTLAPVYELPAHEGLLHARWADATSAVEIYKAGNRIIFEGVPVTREQIAKSIATVASGGKVEDAVMTPLTKLDLAGTKTVSLENAVAAPWTVKAWDAAASSKAIKSFFNIRAAPNMPPNDTMGRGYQDVPSAILFTSREANNIFIEHVARDQGYRAQNENPYNRAKAWIERYDLTFGTANAEMELPPLMQVLDASDSGKSLAFRGGSAMDRLEIWSQEKSTFKPVMAFRFGEDPPTKKEHDFSGREPTSPAAVRWAGLLGDTHVIMMNAGGELIMVEIATGKGVWRSKLSRTDGNICMPALSPDRKLLAVPFHNGIAIVDPLTGKAFNGLPATTEPVGVRSVAFSPDGKQLAAIVNVRDMRALQVYDLSTGETIAEVPLSDRGGWSDTAPRFAGRGYILLGGALVSLEKKATVWHYQFGHGLYDQMHFGSVNPYDKIIYVSPMEGRLPATVVSVDIPHDEAKKAAAQLTVDDLYTWSPGMKVNLTLSVVGDDNFRKAALAEWTKTLKARGIEIDEKSPNQLRVNNMILNGPGDQYQMSSTKEVISTRNQTQGYDISLVVDGKEIWKTAYTTPPQGQGRFGPMFMTVMKKEGESAQQAYDREHPPMTTVSVVNPPPTYIMKERKVDSTALGSKGFSTTETPRGGLRRRGN